jgi:hypothetical protein
LASRLFNRDVHEVDADRFITIDGHVADFLDCEDLGEEAGFPSTPLRDRLRDRWLSGVEATFCSASQAVS